MHVVKEEATNTYSARRRAFRHDIGKSESVYCDGYLESEASVVVRC
jgi:hypothetical protein